MSDNPSRKPPGDKCRSQSSHINIHVDTEVVCHWCELEIEGRPMTHDGKLFCSNQCIEDYDEFWLNQYHLKLPP